MVKRMKSALAIALTLVLSLSMMNGISPKASADESANISLSTAKRYILADAGQNINLNTVDVSESSSSTVKGDTLTWSPADNGVTIENGVLKVATTGVHKVTVSKDTFKMDVYVAAKNESDKEYVLYDENFDSTAEGTLPAGWTRVEGSNASSAVVQNKQFVLNGMGSGDNPSRVKLPDFLDAFGDYQISADVTIAQANDPTRWCSVMYRIQNTNSDKWYPYYQMAVRVNAQNTGVEFAERTPANGWNVPVKKSYTEAIDPSKMYQFKIRVEGDRVRETINDYTVIDTNLATSYKPGGIGLQANGCKMVADNFKVVIPTDKLPIMTDPIVSTYQPKTNIAAPQTIVAAVNAKTDFDAFKDQLPATALMNVNKDLNVVDSTGAVICSATDAINMLGGKIIPAFNVKDTETVNNLTAFLNNNGIYDTFIMSDNPDLVKLARKNLPKIRGIVDFNMSGALTNDQLLDIRRKTNASDAKIAVLPQSVATRKNIEYLQRRLITVWVKTDSGITDKAKIADIITDGSNGIITDNFKGYYDAFNLFSDKGSLVRKSYIIGHRGQPTNAPENTIESASLAYNTGADMVENDIWLSKDNQLVVMHNGTVDSTTDGSGNIEDMTVAELKKLHMTQHDDVYPDAKIPTLEDYFKTFKGKDLVLFIEIKSAKPEIIDPIVKLVNQYQIEDQCVFISFDANQLVRLHAAMPGMSLGLLCNDTFSGQDMSKRIDNTLSSVLSYNSTMNPAFSGLDADYINAMKDRGVTIWPWTIDVISDIATNIQIGAYGITTNYNQLMSDSAEEITPVSDTYTIKTGEKAELNANITTYNGSKTAPCQVVYVSGDNVLKVDGTKVTATATGTCKVMLKYTQACTKKLSYSIYSKTVTLNIEQGSAVSSSETSSSSESNQSSNPTSQSPASSQNTNNPKTGDTAAALFVGLAGLSAALIVIRGKIKK